MDAQLSINTICCVCFVGGMYMIARLSTPYWMINRVLSPREVNFSSPGSLWLLIVLCLGVRTHEIFPPGHWYCHCSGLVGAAIFRMASL